MTEPDQVEFHEVISGPGDRNPGGAPRSMAVRIGIVAGSAALFVIGAVAAMGASPAPSGSAPSPDAGTTPNGQAIPDKPFDGTPLQGMPFAGAMPKVGTPDGAGMDGRGFRLGGFGDITVTAIDGSSLSLKTDDGWSRTIAVDSSTKITKGGQTIAVGDLKVGDQIVFGQAKGSDGTFTITAIRVVLPVVAGQVTAVGDDSITVGQRGNTSATIHVSSSTTLDVDGKSGAKLSDVTVGAIVVAEGTQRSDGSLDATSVHVGTRMKGVPGGLGPMFRGGGNGNHDGPRATPSGTPGTPSSSS